MFGLPDAQVCCVCSPSRTRHARASLLLNEGANGGGVVVFGVNSRGFVSRRGFLLHLPFQVGRFADVSILSASFGSSPFIRFCFKKTILTGG